MLSRKKLTCINGPPTRWRILVGITLLGIFQSLTPDLAKGAKRYLLSELADPYNSNSSTDAVDINDQGVVLVNSWPVGWFLWQNGQTSGLKYSTNGDVLRINNLGHITGYGGITGSSSGWLLTDDGFQILEELPGGQHFNRPDALNDLGEVYGHSITEGLDGVRAVKWDADGSVEDLGVSYQDFDWFVAKDANSDGTVIGYARDFASSSLIRSRAWMWKNGVTTLLPTPKEDEPQSSEAFSINDSGQIAGSFSDGETGYATVWDNNQVTLLPQVPGGINGSASDINDHGEVAGLAWMGERWEAAMWTVEGTGILLSDVVENVDGWYLERANAINNHGLIVGVGTNPAGDRRGFVLTPIVPEPSAKVLSAIAGAWLFLVGYKRRVLGITA